MIPYIYEISKIGKSVKIPVHRTDNSKYWRCGGIGTLHTFPVGYKTVQPLWKSV